MKKVLCFALILFTSLTITSQEKDAIDKEKLKFGIAGGFDVFLFTSLTGVTTSTTFANRTEISEPSTSYVNLFVEKSLSEKYGIRTEIIYAMGGESNTLEIPIIFKYKALKRFNIYSGLQANVLLVKKNEIANKAGFGFNLGTEYYLGKNFFIDVRYVHKFSQLNKTFRVDEAINSIRLGVGFNF
ncbi:hypothetical protein [Polaribacter sp.]|uniref:hypothetical protein n=1 Tax=Polaribacter sp. TaxID=1920175 RepID=UPI003F6AC09D